MNCLFHFIDNEMIIYYENIEKTFHNNVIKIALAGNIFKLALALVW